MNNIANDFPHGHPFGFRKKLLGAFPYSLFLLMVLVATCIIGFSVLAITYASDLAEASYMRTTEAMLNVRDEQFNAFAEGEVAAIKALGPKSLAALEDYLEGSSKADFWIVYDSEGRGIASNGNLESSLIDSFSAMTADCAFDSDWRTSCELATLDVMTSFSPDLSEQCQLPYYEGEEGAMPVLSKVACAALLDEDSVCWGVVLVGRICNNDPNTFAEFSKIAPEYKVALSSFDGVRLTGNFVNEIQNGQLQSQQVVSAIHNGTREYVDTRIESSKREYSIPIICDPVFSYSGNVVGAFTFGYAEKIQLQTRADVRVFFLLFATLIVLLGFGLAWIIAKKLAMPVFDLSQAAQDIASRGFLSIDDIYRMENRRLNTMISIREHDVLKTSITAMAKTLYARQNELCERIATIDSMNDVLEKKVKERTRELQEATEEARHFSALKTKLLLNIGHDVKTPLNSAIGFSDMLLEGCCGSLNARQHDYVCIVRQSAEDIKELFDKILNQSAIEQGKIEFKMEMISSNNFLKQIISPEIARLEKEGIVFETHIDSRLPPVRGDRCSLRRVFSNLFDNAVKFVNLTKEDYPHIVFAATSKNGWLVIRLRDNGSGIKPSDLPHIFEEYYQAETIYTGEREGLGLGLSTAMSIVGAHGGRIYAESEYGTYTEIRVELPLAAYDEEDAK